MYIQGPLHSHLARSPIGEGFFSQSVAGKEPTATTKLYLNTGARNNAKPIHNSSRR